MNFGRDLPCGQGWGKEIKEETAWEGGRNRLAGSLHLLGKVARKGRVVRGRFQGKKEAGRVILRTI